MRLAIHHLPWTQAVFQIGALSVADGALVFVVGLVPVTALELVKLIRGGFARAARGAAVE